MNYAVYTYRIVDGVTECHIIAYKMAASLAASMATPGLTTMVLALEPDQAITAF